MTHEEDDIRAIVKAFCTEMHAWECRCYQRSRKVRKGAIEITEAVDSDESELREVFHKYCVNWQAPKRGASFGKPPGYNPASLEILLVSVTGNRAVVTTREMYGEVTPTQYTYYLKQTDVGWRLEDKRRYIFEDSGLKGETTL